MAIRKKMILKGSASLIVLNWPPMMIADLTRYEICLAFDIPYLLSSLTKIEKTTQTLGWGQPYLSPLSFPLHSWPGQDMIRIFYLIFFLPRQCIMDYQVMFGNQFLISPGGQWHHLNCHLISVLKENPSISFEHIEISDAGKILNYSWAVWHFFSSRLSDFAFMGRWT